MNNQFRKTSKTKNWKDKGRDWKYLKAASTKNDTKVEDNDDTRSVFSDLTFTFTAAPTTAQAYLASDTMGTAIPEDDTIKIIFAASGVCMQVSGAATPCFIDNITIEIPKSQVATIDKRGATIIDQEGNFCSMSMMTLSTSAKNQCRNSGVYRNKLNEEYNPPYLLKNPTSGNNEAKTNPETRPYSIFCLNHVIGGS